MKFLFTVLVLLIATPSFAQVTKLGPGEGLRISWPNYVQGDPDGLDLPDGYRVKAVKPTQTGVVVQSWTIGLDTSLELTSAQLPSGAFSLSVHPYNVAGEAEASQIVGPFGKAAIPKPQTGVVVTKVGAPQ